MTRNGSKDLSARQSMPDFMLHRSPAFQHLKPGGYGFFGQIFLRDLHHVHYAFEPRLTFGEADREAAENTVLDLLENYYLYGTRRTDATNSLLDFLNHVANELCFHGSCATEVFRARILPESEDFPFRPQHVDVAQGAVDEPTEHSNGAWDADTDDPTDSDRRNDVATVQEEPTDAREAPQLAIVPGWSTRVRRGQLQQVRERQGGRIMWQPVDPTALRRVEFADDLGARLAKTFRRLVLADANRSGSQSVIASAGPRNYDRDLHRRRIDELTGSVTRSVGWDGAGTLDVRATTTHKNYRRLRFLDTWLTLVDGVVDHINAIVGDAKLYPDGTFAISLDGIPSRARVAEAARNLVEGTESNDQVFWEVLHPRKGR